MEWERVWIPALLLEVLAPIDVLPQYADVDAGAGGGGGEDDGGGYCD